ncbi:phage head spike fiber domain-containing protein [Pseudomonas sp. NY15364]|uniref:phage head spike fiber domain-containing protein n=1 Tax=Pseudomonas sp. NY15364 TaxID=3400353 RepID=UPI003A885DB7
MAIADKLIHLDTTKTLLRDAIRRAGHYLPDSATFRSYPYAMLPSEASLGLDFVRGEYVAHSWRDGTVSRAGLSNIMTTTRPSGGGYFDHLGVYQWAANNVPRIDHDPATLSTSTSSVTLAAGSVTLAVNVAYTVGSYVRATYDANNWMAGRVTASTGTSVTLWVDRVVGSGTYASWTVIRVLGLLVEESRTNLLTHSSDFSNSVWVKSGLAITENAITAPDGTDSADYAYSSGNASIRHTLPATIGTTYSVSVWMMVPLGLSVGFSLLSGGYGSLALTTVQGTGAWQRVSLTGVATDSLVRFSLGGGLSWAAGVGIYIWGADLQAGASPASHIPTTSAQVTRAADQCVVSNLTDWLGTDNTIIIEHNAPSGRVLLSSGSTVLATSQGPGKLAIAYTATETRICQAGGSVTTSGPLTFDTSLRLLASASAYANAHISVVQSIPRALSSDELQRITA